VAPRTEVISSLANEQDERVQADQNRIDEIRDTLGDFPRRFSMMRSRWREKSIPLLEQHEQLMVESAYLLENKA
jgi:hypothetical protein